MASDIKIFPLVDLALTRQSMNIWVSTKSGERQLETADTTHLRIRESRVTYREKVRGCIKVLLNGDSSYFIMVKAQVKCYEYVSISLPQRR